MDALVVDELAEEGLTLDLLAVAAAGVAGVMIAVYRSVIESQGDESPLWWVQVVLLAGAVLALAGAPTALCTERIAQGTRLVLI